MFLLEAIKVKGQVIYLEVGVKQTTNDMLSSVAADIGLKLWEANTLRQSIDDLCSGSVLETT